MAFAFTDAWSALRNGILLALALGLFVSHWRWLRRVAVMATSGAAA